MQRQIEELRRRAKQGSQQLQGEVLELEFEANLRAKFPRDIIDGVWVAETRCAMPAAIALRQSLIEIAAARQSSEGQQSKMEPVYQYLTGPPFRQRIEAMVEKVSDMQDDLEKERMAMTRLWAKREAQIRGVLEATSGMYGDLQGIAGKALDEIEGFETALF